MTDSVFDDFLAHQHKEGQALSAASDVLELLPLPGALGPPAHYLAKFSCNGVLRADDGTVAVRPAVFVVGIAFPPEYLRRVRPMHVVTWLEPFNVVQPNVKPPFVCLGRIHAGTGLVDLLYQIFEVITYRNFAAHDALDSSAAEWARNNLHLLPVDVRPLKRRTRPDARTAPAVGEHKS